MKKPMFPEMKVYVACSLTHAPETFKQRVEDFKEKLREVCEVLCFLSIGENTPYGVYTHDIHGCVMRSDLVVAISDLPSTGLGYEIATQTEARKKPLLAVAHKDALVTDLIQDPRLPDFWFVRYGDLVTDVVPMVRDILTDIWNRKNDHPLFPLHLTDEEQVA